MSAILSIGAAIHGIHDKTAVLDKLIDILFKFVYHKFQLKYIKSLRSFLFLKMSFKRI